MAYDGVSYSVKESGLPICAACGAKYDKVDNCETCAGTGIGLVTAEAAGIEKSVSPMVVARPIYDAIRRGGKLTVDKVPDRYELLYVDPCCDRLTLMALRGFANEHHISRGTEHRPWTWTIGVRPHYDGLDHFGEPKHLVPQVVFDNGLPLDYCPNCGERIAVFTKGRRLRVTNRVKRTTETDIQRPDIIEP